ncbi:DUF2262 domain-containing protein [Natrinema salaciae]|uniref:DUF2262 domain-containing protein n=1 Tax=Natrinema salaciae TaxID=1186196 RepID=UPI000B80BC86|nr:DUF2262 domain-containing protein [Natrinema salaciae]
MDNESPDSAHSQDPEMYEDEQLGTFERKSSRGLYSTTAEWMGTEVELELWLSEPDDGVSGLTVAKALWDDQSTWTERIQQYALDELLELKNVEWIESEDDTVTAEEFTDRIDLKTVTIDHDGGFTFWHDDDDLFFGHSIMVSGNLENGIFEAHL